jgi:hypothetical protein
MSIQVRRDIATSWTSTDPTLAEGELGLETDTGKLKIGDGTSSWKSLTYLSDSVEPLALIVQGSNYGYTIGGINNGPQSGTALTDVQRFSFTSDGNATDIGDITQGRFFAQPGTSDSNAYVTGGFDGNSTYYNTIYKFAFSSPVSTTDVGNLVAIKARGYGTSSPSHGYATGGRTPNATYVTSHDKYAFASDGDATDDGDLSLGRMNIGSSGNSSSVASYFPGGYTDPADPANAALANTISKIPFAAGGTATDVGDSTTTINDCVNTNSSDSGYITGIYAPSGVAETLLNRVEKFSYASDANSVDTQDLFSGVWLTSGSSSTTHGYVSAGRKGVAPPSYTPFALTNEIQKFPFANNTTGTDVGDVVTTVTRSAGNQN